MFIFLIKMSHVINCCEVYLSPLSVFADELGFGQYADEVQSGMLVRSGMNCLSVKSVCCSPVSILLTTTALDFWCGLPYYKDTCKPLTKEDLFFEVFKN